MIKLLPAWTNWILYAKEFLHDKANRYKLAVYVDLACICLIFFVGTHGQNLAQKLLSPLGDTSLADYPKTLNIGNGITVMMPNLQSLATKDMRYKSFILKQASDFMSLEPDSKERLTKELATVRFLSRNNASASDMILVLKATATRPARAWALEYLWNLRQNSRLVQFSIYPLDEKRIQWAKAHSIDPSMLAIATDLYGPTLQILSAEPQLFFEAAKNSKGKDTQLYKYIPNPAVVAKLQMSETSWGFEDIQKQANDLGFIWDFSSPIKEDRAFSNIGTVNAWDALNLSPEWFPSGHDDLQWIARNLERSSGLPYSQNVYSLPGSVRGAGDGSGGAIGPQFMPINARLFMTWYQKANARIGNVFPDVNPFDPWTGTMLAYLYLTSEFYHRQSDIYDVTNVVRPGYAIIETAGSTTRYDPKSDPRIKALLKWNPLYWEAKSAIVAGEEYNKLWQARDIAYRVY